MSSRVGIGLVQMSMAAEREKNISKAIAMISRAADKKNDRLGY